MIPSESFEILDENIHSKGIIYKFALCLEKLFQTTGLQ